MKEELLYQRRRAARALLMRPMLRADGESEDFGLIRTHAEWLRDWFGKQLGWSLHVDTEVARLGKTPEHPLDCTRPARDPERGVVFTRVRYVLFCLALACLEKGERQTTLGDLAEAVRATFADEPTFSRSGLSFDLSVRESRNDLVHVIHLLIDLGVIVRIHGDESQYLAAKGDVLYTVHRPAISAILNVRRGPSSIQSEHLEDRISALLEEPLPDTEEGWNRHLRTRLMRKLVDDPVLYYDELDADEKAYLDSQRPFLLRAIEEGTGLTPEVRAEGIALVDEAGDLTDLGMPCEGTEGHFALLMAEFLSEATKSAPSVPVGIAELEAAARERVQQYGKYWRKDAREPGAEKTLLAEALYRLEALKLIRRAHGGSIIPLPAIARYAVAAPVQPKSEERHLALRKSEES